MRNLLLSSMMCLMVMLGVSGNAMARDGHDDNRHDNRPAMAHQAAPRGHLDGPGGRNAGRDNTRHDNARHDNGHSRGYSNDRYYCKAMSSSSFNSLLSALKIASYSDKMNILKSALSSNNISAEQAASVIRVMGYKSYEEDAAAAMYSSVCDKENWINVYNAFSFSGSVSAVNRRIDIDSSVNKSNRYGICQAMSNSSFSTLLNTLAKSSTSDKLEILKTAAKTNNFTVSQVAQVINKMSFKSYEEDAAVILYSSVCDTNNWFELANAFSFSSSFSEVSKRI